MPAAAAPPRLTPQRRAVLDALRASHDHPTAAELLERVRAGDPRIGAATVYRSLALLVEQGQALELTLGEGHGRPAARYDANTDRHDHVVCSRCGAAKDLHVELPAALLASVAAQAGEFALHTHDLQFRGLCPACRA